MKLHPITVQIDEFMLYCESKGLSKKTMSSYEQTLKLFNRFLSEVFEVHDAKKITADMLRKYIKHLQERGKYTVVSSDLSKIHNQPDPSQTCWTRRKTDKIREKSGRQG